MNKFVVGLVKFGRAVLRLFYPVKVYGDRTFKNKKSVIVGNHISAWDPLIYTMRMKYLVSFVYKAEFTKSKFLSYILNGLDSVPVNRGEADLNATKSILRLLKDDKAVCIFPEGTRNPNVDCLQEFHTGAALFALKTKAPIRPFYIWEKTKIFHKNYMIVGDEFTLDEFYDQPINKQTLEDATAAIRNKVDDLRLQLNEILDAKGVKRRPRTRKEIEKINLYNEQLAEQQASNNTSQEINRENLAT